MSFIEQRLLEALAYGFSGGPTFSTKRVELENGMSRRNVKRSRPLHQFRGSFDRRREDEVHTLLAAFMATAGAAYGFRFKNPLDYRVIGQPLGEGTGVEQQIQLTRTFAWGVETRSYPIRKPVQGTVVVLANGAPISASVDATTGMVTVTAAPGDVLTWSGEFDVPVTFESDEFAATIENYDATTVDVNLIEDLTA